MAVIGSLFWHFDALTLLQGEEKDGAYVSIRQHTSAYVRHLNALLLKVKRRTEQPESVPAIGRASQGSTFVLEKQVLFVLVKHENFETVPIHCRQSAALSSGPYFLSLCFPPPVFLSCVIPASHSAPASRGPLGLTAKKS